MILLSEYDIRFLKNTAFLEIPDGVFMKIYCPCDEGFDIEYRAVIDLDREPEIQEQILDGSFSAFKCPRCGKEVKPELKTRLEWPSKKTVLLFVPEAERFACLSFCAGLKQVDLDTEKEADGVYVQADETPVIGYGELVERIRVIRAGLDVSAVEVLKFLVLEQGKETDGKNIKFLFQSITDGGALRFYVYGLRAQKDEVAVMNIPRKLYDSVMADKQKNGKSEIFRSTELGSYISYQNMYIGHA